MASDHDLRTQFAIEANDLADALNAALGTIRLRPCGYKPELTKPEGISTGGGIAGMQHLRLVPATGQRILVVGHANRAERTAELRSYDHIDTLHRKQFHVPVELDRHDYEQFLEMAGNLMAVLRLDTAISGVPRFSMRASMKAPPTRRFSWSAFVIGMVVAAVLLAAALYWTRIR